MYANFKNHLSKILKIPETYISDCESFYKIKKIRKNEFLLREGEICEEIFFVEKGLLKMYSIDKKGKEHIIQFAPENWLISDRSSIFFNEKSRYFIESIEESEVIFLQQNFFVELAQIYPEFVEKNNILINNHIRSLQKRINQLLGATAEERYLDFIKTYPNILQRVPQHMVASYLGVTPESLSRVRKELVKNDFSDKK